MEQWKDIKDYERLYQVSNYGNIKSMDRHVKCARWGEQFKIGKMLSSKPNKNGYVYVTLVKDGQSKYFRVQRLVAHAFIKNPINKPFVNHKDGNKSNNHVDNLEWCTGQENSIHKSIVLGKQKGATNSTSKLVIDLETGIYYDTLKSACEAKSLNYKKTSHIVSGSRIGYSTLKYA